MQVQGKVAAEQQVFLNFIGPKYCIETPYVDSW